MRVTVAHRGRPPRPTAGGSAGAPRAREDSLGSVSMTRLHLFDLDGTLIRGSAAAIEISRQLGVEREIDALEREFAAGGLSTARFAERACALWGELTQAQVAAAFEGAPWLTGIREGWAVDGPVRVGRLGAWGGAGAGA